MAAKKKVNAKGKKVSKTNELQTFGVPELEKLLENTNKAEQITFNFLENLKPLIKNSFKCDTLRTEKVTVGESPLDSVLTIIYERLNSFSELLDYLNDNLTLKADTSNLIKSDTVKSNTTTPYICGEYESLIVSCTRFSNVFYELVESAKPYISSVDYADNDKEEEPVSSFALLVSYCNNTLGSCVNSKYNFIFKNEA